MTERRLRMPRTPGVLRPVRALLALGVLLLPLYAAPTAHAAGLVACTITGTIRFFPSSDDRMQGAWNVGPAVIDCRGLFRGLERILGPGSFSGSGTYAALPTGTGSCLHHVGSGTVDYWLFTSGSDVHLKEPHSFVLAGAGTFTTPTLRGTFLVTPPGDGDCLTKPVTRALFVAQAVVSAHPRSIDRGVPRRLRQPSLR
jgi:hypothetical protein